MSRPLRIYYPNAHYHVHARGNERRRIFWEDREFEWFCDLLGETCQKFDIKLYAFVLMPNHFHLMLSTPQANLSRAMHWLKTSYTVWLNRRRERVGHLFQGRFCGKLVEDESHFLELSRYIHLNPVRSRLVELPEHYPWNSFIDYLKEERQWPWIDRDTLLYELGGTDDRRYERYKEFVHAGIGLPDSLNDKFRKGAVLGSDAFRERLTREMKSMETRGVLGASELCKQREMLPCKDAVERIHHELIKEMPHYTSHRPILIYLLCQLGYTHREIGAYYGISASAVSHCKCKYRPCEIDKIKLDRILSLLNSFPPGSTLGR